MNWISAQPGLDASRISLLGHSQGTIIAAAVARRLNADRRIQSVAMWAPNVEPSSAYRSSMGDAAYLRGLNAGPNEIIEWIGAAGTPRRFNSGFVQDLANFDTGKDIGAFDGPLLVVTGRRDRLSPTWKAEALSRHHPERISFAEFDVDHRIGASQGLASVEHVAKHTLDWLLENNVK